MTSLTSRADFADRHLPQTRSERMVPSAILVVEDEPEILQPLCHTLRRAGHIVLEAEDGLSACRIIGSQQPDLILLDIMLPDLDGWEVCRMLRQHPERQVATTPVIMLTALNSPENKLRGLEVGADAYLPKPYSQQEVLLLSGKLIERHRRQVELEEQVARLSSMAEQQQELHRLLFHELRNQLTILSGYSELLQQQGGDPNDFRLAAIHRSADYLQSLAEDFLLIRQVQEGRLDLPVEPLLIEAVASEILNLYNLAALSRGISLQLQVIGRPRPTVSNRPALRIILSALLDNAIKYGPENHPVRLVCSFSDSHLTFELYDDGPGIATEDREQVFDRFYRGRAAQGVDGNGLGLYGARILARALGGDAEINDQYGQGNCLKVWIPYALQQLKYQSWTSRCA